ncbi:unnamed protein product [Aureobasidium vineae]|uniref:Uncharacterized protein n=1 Tax=Aureobasidium vineae TaxID=2773715 RepID=A0A9N8JA40_9PEZI|nr:unnamed protein product [Aureobasidium vineae]
MHPRIGPQVQAVILTPLRAFPEALSILVPPNSPIHQESDPEKIKAYATMVHHYLNRAYEETELEQSGDTMKLLTAAFMSLGKYDRRLCLSVSDVENNIKEAHIGARGCLSSNITLQIPETNVWKMRWEETVGVSIKAVTNSGCLVARLSLESYTNPEHMDNAGLWSHDLDGDINLLSPNMTAFDVDITCHGTDAVLKSVKQVLSQAMNLNILTVQQIGPPLSFDFAELSSFIVSDSLEAMNLSNVWCKESDLVMFFNTHRDTLEHLWLYRIRIVGSWRSLVQWIRLNLTALHTFGMDEVLDDEYQPDKNDEPVPACNFDEVDDMQAALQGLLAKPERKESDEVEVRDLNN